MAKFQFITTSDNPGTMSQNMTIRRKIRRVAATRPGSQHYHSNANESQTQRQASNTSQKGSMHRFRLGSTTKVARKTKGDRKTSLTSVSFWDPIVDPLGGDAWELLHYYRYLFRSKSWTVTAKADWFSFIIEDRAATHATLAFVALNNDLETSKEVSKRALHHRASALTQIRKALTSNNENPSDGILGAIALLAVTEGLEGHNIIFHAHIEALAKLIVLRGGYQKLLQNAALCRLITWADLCSSTVFGANVNLLNASNTPIIRSNEELYQRPGMQPTHFEIGCRDILPEEGSRLVALLNALPLHYPSDDTTAAERQRSSQNIQNVQQHILLHRAQYIEPLEGSEDVWTSLLWRGTSLYTCLVLKHMPRKSEVILERINMIQLTLAKAANLAQSGKTELGRVHHTVLLWAQAAYFCALLPEQRTELVTQELRASLAALSIKGVDALQEALSDITWIRSFCEIELADVVLNETN